MRHSKVWTLFVASTAVACTTADQGRPGSSSGSTSLSTSAQDDDGGDDPGSTTSGDDGDAGGTPSGGDTTTSGDSGGATSSSSTDTGGSTGPGHSAGSGTTGEVSDCPVDPDADFDMDGYSVNEGDCNDCDPNVNPNAVEVEVTEVDPDTGVVPEPADEDCDGFVDNLPMPCDGGLMLESADPLDGAAAMGLCKVAEGADDWGLVSATYVRADGTPLGQPLQHGLQSSFGDNVVPQEGETLLNLSSGFARVPGQPNSCDALTCTASDQGTAPGGFPQDVPGCAGQTTIFDDVGLEVTLRAPSNAIGYQYSFSFYSFEYPEWVCTSFNDQFIALVTPPPMGSINGNISFDSMNNPVSVNVAFFDVCEGCPLGTADLQGTGFDVWDDAGGTSWLTTTAPIEPGAEVTIRFAIWDTGDQAWDSSVILDDFQWIGTGGNVEVSTLPK